VNSLKLDDPIERAPDPVAAEATWISKTPGVCGGAARIRDTRITVWGLVAWRKLGLSEAEVRQRVPEATLADLHAAWSYYETNRDEIDRALAENASF
jgi:uncharacterized protein (DUF433 family)